MATATWYSDGNHDWDATNAWNSQADGGGTAGNPDTSDDHAIIQNGDTVTLTGNEETGSVMVDDTGTIVGGGNTLTLNGSTDANVFRWDGTISGDFNISIEGGANKHIKDNGGTNNINNLTINNTGNTTELDTALTLDGNLTITAGTLDTTTSDFALTVTGKTLINGGTLTCNASTISLKSGVNNNLWGLQVSSGTFNGGTGTHTIGGIRVSGGTLTFTNNNTTINAGETSSSAGAIYISGSPTVNTSSGTVIIDTSSTLQFLLYNSNLTLHNLTINSGSTIRLWQPTSDGSGTELLTVAGALTINGALDTDFSSQDDVNLTVTGNTSGAGTLALNNSTYTSSNGHLSMDGGTLTIGTSGVITGVDQLGESGGSKSTITCTGSPTLGCRRWRQLQTHWTPATSTLKVEDGAYTFGNASSYAIPYNFEVDNAGHTNELDAGFTVSNNLTITAGTLDTTTSDFALTVTGNVEIENGGTLTGNGSAISMGSLATGLGGAGGTYSATTATTTITKWGTSTKAIYANGPIIHNGGTFAFTNTDNNGGIAIQLEGGAGSAGTQFKNITFSGDSTYRFPYYGNDITISGDVTMSGTPDIKQWRRNLIVTGDVTIGNGCVYDCEGSGVGGVSSNFTAGSLTIDSGGTFKASSGTTTLTGDFNNTGTFTHNSGLVTMNASAANITINGTGTVEPAFHDLTYEGSNDVRVRRDITVEDTLNINGSRFLFGATSGGGQADATLTMGTTSAKGTLTVQTGKTFDFYVYDDGHEDKLQGASTLFPVDITVNGTMNFSVTTAEPDTGKVQLANINYIGALTLDNGDKVELTGDCEFDAVTVSSGATLDLNGQRMEMSGTLNIDGTFDADGLIVSSGSIDEDGSFANAASCDMILLGATSHDLRGATHRNIMINTGTDTSYFNATKDLGTTPFTVASGIFEPGTSGRDVTCGDFRIATGGTFTANPLTELTVAGDFTTSGGLIGKSALVFDNSGDYVECPYDAATDITNTLTMTAWMKSTGTDSYEHLICKQGGYYFLSMIQHGGVGKAIIRIYDGANIDAQGTSQINDGKWHHIAGTYDTSAGKLRIYVDGKLEAETDNSDAISHGSSKKIYIGANDSSSNIFNGTIAQASLWNVALTQAQIRAKIFSDFASLDSNTGCIGWWQFDEGTGTTVDNKGSEAADLDGTITGAAWAGAGTFTQSTSTVDLTGTGALTYQGEIDFNILKTAAATKTTTVQRLSSGDININTNLYKGAGTLTTGSSIGWRLSRKTGVGDVNNSGLVVSGASYPVDLSSSYIVYYHDATIAKEVKWQFFINGSDTTFAANQEATGYWHNAAFQTDVGDYNLKCTYMRYSDAEAGKFTMGSGDLWLTNNGSGVQATYPSNTFTVGPGATVSGSTAGTNFKSQNNFSVVGSIENFDVVNEELKVTGQVINCTGDIHQYFPTIDHDQQLDADTADDRDVNLGRDLDKNTELINS